MRKRIAYSQNFLRDPALVARLLDTTTLRADDTVVEIGPGEGIITAELVRRCRRVVAIERDRALAARVTKRLRSFRNLRVVETDFLRYALPSKPYRVFANIPFNITSDVVRALLDCPVPPTDTYLVVQQQAAEKFGGVPVGAHESLFSVLHKPWIDISVTHTFHPTDFNPVPAVPVVLMHMAPRRKPLITDEDAQRYRDFVVYGFTSVRHTVKEAYEDVFSHRQFTRLARDLGFAPQATPTQLGFDHWLGLFDYFRRHLDNTAHKTVAGAQNELKRRQGNLTKIHRYRAA